MSLAKIFKEYKEEIELICAQNPVECDLYSIIAHILRECEYGNEISLRDVSTRRTTVLSKPLRGGGGFPDFVVLKREKKKPDILGCIEAKRITEDLDKERYLEQLEEHIAFYKKVIYTNGLTWRLYESKNKPKSENEPKYEWEIVLGEFNGKSISWNEDEEWYKLLSKLKEIEWLPEEK